MGFTKSPPNLRWLSIRPKPINTILARIGAITIINSGRLGIEADADASSRACSAENLSNNSNTINLWVFCFFIKPLIKRPLDIFVYCQMSQPPILFFNNPQLLFFFLCVLCVSAPSAFTTPHSKKPHPHPPTHFIANKTTTHKPVHSLQ